VLGSGVVGLCTALVLLERGYKVKIVASEFPKANSYDPDTKYATQPLVTSQVAAGFIVPFSQKIIAGQVTDCLV
jgi:glycine/D-amino acid oxidase-like deaminating enzyme